MEGYNFVMKEEHIDSKDLVIPKSRIDAIQYCQVEYNLKLFDHKSVSLGDSYELKEYKNESILAENQWLAPFL